MPRVSRKVYATSLSSNGEVKGVWVAQPKQHFTGVISINQGNVGGSRMALLAFDNIAPILNTDSLSVHISVLNGNSTTSSYVKGSPCAYGEIYLDSYLANFKESVGSDVNIDLTHYLSEIKNTHNGINFRMTTALQNIEINNSTGNTQQGVTVTYQLDPNLTAHYLEYYAIVPAISNFTITGNRVDGVISASWSIVDGTNWKLQAIKDGNVIAERTGTTENTVNFNPSELPVGDVTFRLYAYYGNETVYEDNQKTLTAPEPRVSAININGTSLDNITTVTANGENIYNWTVQVIQGGTVRTQKSGTGNNISATFNVGEIPLQGESTVRIVYSNTWINGYEDEIVTFTAPQPNANDIKIDGTIIDNKITLTANGKNVYNWNVQVIQNGVEKCIHHGTGNAINTTFNEGEIRNIGVALFRVNVSNTWNHASVDYTATLVRNEPVIIAVEPSGVNMDRGTAITCSWTTQNQHSFALDFNGTKYSGSTQKSIIIPANTLDSLGTKHITLTISYRSSWGEVRTASKTVSFNAVGTPSTPQLDANARYDTAVPTFTWTCKDAYVQYRVQVLLGENIVDDSTDVLSSSGSYTCLTTLENTTTYTVRVKVKTQYGYWSDWGSGSFTTNFVVANRPDIEVFVTDRGIAINSSTVYSDTFSHCDIYRRTDFSDWIRIAYNLDNIVSFIDSYVGKETYYYKVTSVSTAGGKNDSEEVSATVEVKNFNFTNVENLTENVEFIYDPEVNITVMRNTAESLYDSVYAPVVDVGEQCYKKGSCSFLAEKQLINEFVAMLNKTKILLYRDGRGEKIFCHVVGNVETTRFAGEWYTVAFSFTEVPFLEEDLYHGNGNTCTVFWDGAHKWDGTVNWSGEGGPIVNG